MEPKFTKVKSLKPRVCTDCSKDMKPGSLMFFSGLHTKPVIHLCPACKQRRGLRSLNNSLTGAVFG
jgi:hypothetical protein